MIASYVRGLGVLVVALACLAPAAGQTIYKCKSDGRITYSNVPCAQPDAAAAAPAAAERAGAAPGAAAPGVEREAPAQPLHRATLPKECDNAASLQYVVARLDNPSTPDDIREFLADERFRLLRCEFTRFTSDERRDRDAAMRDLNAREAAKRKAAVARIEALYDRYLTPNERAARARARSR
jgi:hypothetical protein